jgi:SecD/SecF fusion protein
MSTLVRNAIILLCIVAVCIWAIYPPESKLRRGKDIAGGVSLIYGVDIKPGDPSDTLSKVATNVKERLDPAGVLEITVVPMGSDRLEITMPLPSAKVEALKKAFEEELAKVGTASMSRDELERIAALPEAQRTEAIKKAAGKDASRGDRIVKAILDFEAKTKARAEYDPAEQNVKFIREQIRTAGGESSQDPIVTALKDTLKTAEAKRDSLRSAAAAAEAAYEASSKEAVTAGLNPADLRRALTLSDKPFRLLGKDGKAATLDSPRKRAIDEIVAQFPNQKAAIDAAIAKWKEFESKRSGLDDPQDVVRILKGAGVLNFRIAVSPGELPNQAELLAQLKAGGPRSVKFDDARFFKVNKIEQWVEKVDELEALKQSAAAYFANRRLVAEEYKGAYYVLCWDKRGLRLTEQDGQWMLAKAYPDADELGRPAIAFEMDLLGGEKLGKLTEPNKGRNMAVLLDDEVYTAPTLQSAISNRGRITGSFQQSEIDYVVRVLSAGSLKAKLTPEPISSSILGPTLGQENLDKGLAAGVIAFVVVGSFMVLYYFSCGLISVVALSLNALMIVAAMALNQAAFTLPGIAGIILTFGMAVDANVLIYERMREEMNLGHDLRTGIRLGYGRALSAIVDGHVTSLIAAVVLGFTGTQEIKGFALTLGIGIVTSLFSQLFATRFLFTFLVEKLHWRRITMLSMAMNWKLQPHIDWLGIRFFSYAVSFVIAGMGLFFLVYQGSNLLGTEFRGGTAVTLVFKNERLPDGSLKLDANGQPVPVTMDRDDVKAATAAIAKEAPAGSPLKVFDEAEIIAVNPEADGRHSQKFTIKTLVTDPKVVQEVLVAKFIKDLDVRQALAFKGSDQTADRADVFPITSPNIGEVIGKPGKGGTAPEFDGGLAIVLDDIQPEVPEQELRSRLEATRQKSEFADIGSRPWELRVLEGASSAVKSAVILVRDPEVSFQDRKRWELELRDREWAITTAALTQAQTLAEVQSFSPAVASSFRAQAITAVILSTLLIVIYVWVRFNSFRYSLAAIVCTLHDCLVAIGFVALASVIYYWNPKLAGMLGILPFKIDLNVVAAVLTILGYSLNDTIIVMDRIRENRGKLPYASRKVINDAINQTISRTIITAGTTFLATMVLYIVGGEGVRVFAYTMLIGILVGTYSSIAVAAPLLWVKAVDPHGNEPSAGLSGGGTGQIESGRAAA